MKFKYLLTLALLSIPALAKDENLSLKYGTGIIQSKGSQIVALSYQKPFYYSLNSQLETGAWLDQNKSQGRTGSGYGSYSLGLKIVRPWFWAESMHGIGFITNPDAYLGGTFQFFHDIGLGIKDEKDFRIGVQYKHISSAGIHKPNIGRNFVVVKLGFPF